MADLEEWLKQAIQFHQNGKLDEAKACYLQALTSSPKDPRVLYGLGALYFQENDFKRARPLLEEFVETNPNSPQAHNLLANVLQDTGEPERARCHYENAIRLDPKNAGAYNNLGSLLKSSGKFEEAGQYFERAIQLDPAHATAHYNLGSLFKETGKLDEAVRSYRKALELNPHYVEALNNLGLVAMALGHPQDAQTCLRKALQLNPRYVAAWINLGRCLGQSGDVAGEKECCRRALEIAPDSHEAYNNLGSLLSRQAKIEESLAAYEKASSLCPSDHGIHSNYLLSLNYHGKIPPQDLLSFHRHWGDQFPKPASNFKERNRRVDRRLKIGYVSPDFRMHSVAYFLEPIFRRHDAEAFEIYAYSDVEFPDEVTRGFQGLAHQWRPIHGLSAHQVKEQILKDEIDILVDLAGHTSGNRLPVFALKPAPIQASYLGYPSTTGLPMMDYRLTDSWADPEGSEAGYSESLHRLPDGFLAFQPPSKSPDPGPPPALKNGTVTFGSFNNLAKINSGLIALWSKVLHAVPESRILLKSKMLSDPETRADFHQKFAASGIAAERVELVDWIASRYGHLGAYHGIDIALDSYPYHGTTTTCEALWMGVPVVTLVGGHHAARVGYSLLMRRGLEEIKDFAALNPQDYVRIASGLAQDHGRLQNLRGKLRSFMQHSSLCDSALITRSLEDAYRVMWRKWAGNI